MPEQMRSRIATADRERLGIQKTKQAREVSEQTTARPGRAFSGVMPDSRFAKWLKDEQLLPPAEASNRLICVYGDAQQPGVLVKALQGSSDGLLIRTKLHGSRIPCCWARVAGSTEKAMPETSKARFLVRLAKDNSAISLFRDLVREKRIFPQTYRTPCEYLNHQPEDYQTGF